MISMSGFGERLQLLAVQKKISQAELAKGINKDPSTVNKWWNSKRPPFSKNIAILADFFGCDAGWLSTGKGEPFPDPSDTFITGKDQIFSVNGNVNGSPSIYSDHSDRSRRSIKGGVRINSPERDFVNYPRQGGAEPTLPPDIQYMLKLIDRFENRDEIIDEVIGMLNAKLRGIDR